MKPQLAEREPSIYNSINGNPPLFPVALEIRGPTSVSTQEFLAQIGRRLTEMTTDPRETAFLFQRVSVAVQRFYAGAYLLCLADTFAQFRSPHHNYFSHNFCRLIFQFSGIEY